MQSCRTGGGEGEVAFVEKLIREINDIVCVPGIPSAAAQPKMLLQSTPSAS